MGGATIDDLFRVTFTESFNGVELTFRALSETDIQARDEYALLARARKRKSLRDPDSDDHLRYLEWLEGADDDSLKQALVGRERAELFRRALLDIQEQLIPMPDDADEQEKLETLAARDAEEKRVSTARATFVEEGTKKYEAVISDLAHDALYQKARSAVFDTQTAVAYQRAFNRYTLYAVTFEDAYCQSRYFKSPEAVGELTLDKQAQMLNRYYQELGRIQERDLRFLSQTEGSPDSAKPLNGRVQMDVGLATDHAA